jgi:hypothetical protein
MRGDPDWMDVHTMADVDSRRQKRDRRCVP